MVLFDEKQDELFEEFSVEVMNHLLFHQFKGIIRSLSAAAFGQRSVWVVVFPAAAFEQRSVFCWESIGCKLCEPVGWRVR